MDSYSNSLNIMKAIIYGESIVVTDFSGQIFRDTSSLAAIRNYEIHTVNMNYGTLFMSDTVNLLAMVHTDDDLIQLAKAFAPSPYGAVSDEEILLIAALLSYEKYQNNGRNQEKRTVCSGLTNLFLKEDEIYELMHKLQPGMPGFHEAELFMNAGKETRKKSIQLTREFVRDELYGPYISLFSGNDINFYSLPDRKDIIYFIGNYGRVPQMTEAICYFLKNELLLRSMKINGTRTCRQVFIYLDKMFCAGQEKELGTLVKKTNFASAYTYSANTSPLRDESVLVNNINGRVR